MPPDLPTATFALPSLLLDPLTCSSCCKQRNEPLPSPTDRNYIGLVKGLRSAFPKYLNIQLQKELYIPTEDVCRSILSYLKEVIIVTRQPLKLLSVPQYVKAITFPSSLTTSGSTEYLYSKLLDISNTLASLIRSEKLSCLHQLLNRYRGQKIHESAEKQANDMESTYGEYNIVYDLKSWAQVLVSKRKLKGDAWSSKNDWEGQIKQVVRAIFHVYESRSSATLAINDATSFISRFEIFLRWEDPIKLFKMFREISTLSPDHRVVPRLDISGALAVPKDEILEVILLLESSSLFQQWLDTKEVEISDEAQLKENFKKYSCIKCMSGRNWEEESCQHDGNTLKEFILEMSRRTKDVMNWRSIDVGIRTTAPSESSSSSPSSPSPSSPSSPSLPSSPAPSSPPDSPLLLPEIFTTPIEGVKISKSAARRRRKAIAKQELSIVQPSLSTSSISGSFTPLMDDNLLIPLDTTDDDIEEVLSSVSAQETPKPLLASLPSKLNQENLVLEDIESAVYYEGSDYDDLPGLDDATDSENESE